MDRLTELLQLFARSSKRDTPKPKAWLSPDEDQLVPPRELWIGPDDSISHYFRWIWEYLAYLVLLTHLKRTSHVLELGCGHGRTARGLLDYLRSPGRYVGLDVDRRRIADAQSRIQSRWPNFEFVHADVYSREYNPSGTHRAEVYRFPFADSSFDVVYGASLITHLLPLELRNYFSETGRVLRPGGYCLFSAFVLDHYLGPGTAISPMYELTEPLPGYPGVSVRDLEYPDTAIGFRVVTIRELLSASELDLVRIMPGLWCASTDWAVNEHDLLLFRRR